MHKLTKPHAIFATIAVIVLGLTAVIHRYRYREEVVAPTVESSSRKPQAPSSWFNDVRSQASNGNHAVTLPTKIVFDKTEDGAFIMFRGARNTWFIFIQRDGIHVSRASTPGYW